jgi:hypothetical protein
MGLFFSSYRKELSSRGFRRAYEGLRAECPELFHFADPSDLIAFFHDQAADLDRKDAILFDLVTRYRNDNRHRDIAPLFIVLFTPALASIYTSARRRYPAIDREDLIQDLCLFLIQIIRESAITPYKVAGRIVGELRNRIRGLLNLIPDEEFVALKGDGTDAFETRQPVAAANDAEVERHSEHIRKEIMAFLDRLIRAGKISRKDRRILLETFIGGKSLKDLASTRDYERLKHRRRQVIAFIRKNSASD